MTLPPSIRFALAAMIALPLALAGLILALPQPTPTTSTATNPAIAILNVAVFDGETLLSERQTIIIQDGRIAAMGADIKAPEGATIVDGAGRTLLPVLIDAHTHVYGDVLGDALRFGVGAELDMFSAPAGLPALRAARESMDNDASADVFSAGMLATAPGGHGTQFGVPVDTITEPAAALAWVDARIAEGSDYIKIVYEAPGVPYTGPSVNRETLAALIQAAHARGKLAVVHSLWQQSVQVVVEEGADGLVHVFMDAPNPGLIADIARRGMFVIPTLSVYEGFAGGSDWRTPALEARLSAGQRAALQPPRPAPVPRAALSQAQANVAALAAAGVTLLAGSDAPNPGTAHGVSVHRELMLLVEAGLTPTQALRAATTAPADRFSLEGRGRIRLGDRADLLLVQGDPTQDIAASQAIVGVWKNGVGVDLDGVQANAAAIAPMLISDFSAASPASAFGVDWAVTTDAMIGGGSRAALAVTPEGTLRIEGAVAQGAVTPWAGAAVAFTQDWSELRDLSAIQSLRLRVRSDTPGTFRVMAFGQGMTGAPPEHTFATGADWRDVTVPLADFVGFDASAARAFAVVAGPQPGGFALEIDDVRFE